jgi:acyl-CoA thioesterase YciA
MNSNTAHATEFPRGKDPVLRMQPGPNDVNMHGDVFGGWIMAQVDIAGGITAARRARGRVATVAVNQFIFKLPVFVGDVLSFFCEVERVGNTSITVKVEVFAERGPRSVDVTAQQAEIAWSTAIFKVTEAQLTYVATGTDRKPRKVPPQEPGWLGVTTSA